MTYTISTTHPLYDDFSDSWVIMRDTIGGEDDVKDRGQSYLPMKSGMKAIADDKARSAAYASYQLRAEFPEIVAPTARGSTGLMCDVAPTIELPPALEYLREDCVGDGTPLDVFHRKVVEEVMQTGRYGILPGVNFDGTFNLAGYKAEHILNWDKVRNVVNFVVLDETDYVRDPAANSWNKVEQYLELRLDENAYVARRWVMGTDTKNMEGGEDEIAQGRDGKPLNFVPFVFINTSNLNPEPDDVPLYGLAKIALRIYRLDADFMQGLHMTSEPTPYVTGFDDALGAIERGEVPTTIGASKIWILPKNATANFLEFSGPGLEAQAKAIDASLERAVMFGAQVLSEGSRTAESGESRKLRLRSQHTTVKTIAMTAAAGLERALRNIAIWEGVDPKLVTVKPYLDFMDYTLSPQDLDALIRGWQAGGYSKRTLFHNLQRGDVIPLERNFDDEEEYIKNDPALGGLTTGDNVI